MGNPMCVRGFPRATGSCPFLWWMCGGGGLCKNGQLLLAHPDSETRPHTHTTHLHTTQQLTMIASYNIILTNSNDHIWLSSIDLGDWRRRNVHHDWQFLVGWWRRDVSTTLSIVIAKDLNQSYNAISIAYVIKCKRCACCWQYAMSKTCILEPPWPPYAPHSQISC